MRGINGVGARLFTKFMLYPPVNGAYTELFAGFSPEVTLENTDAWSKSCTRWPSALRTSC
jgi:hypothetical protein